MVPGVWCSAHVPHIVFRTCSEHVPNIQECYFHQHSPYGMPSRPQIREIRHFRKLFTLLVFLNQILKIAIFTISMRPKIQIPTFHVNLGACSAHVPHISCSEQCSGPTKTSSQVGSQRMHSYNLLPNWMTIRFHLYASYMHVNILPLLP